jgi:hypothetical protein
MKIASKASPVPYPRTASRAIGGDATGLPELAALTVGEPVQSPVGRPRGSRTVRAGKALLLPCCYNGGESPQGFGPPARSPLDRVSPRPQNPRVVSLTGLNGRALVPGSRPTQMRPFSTL